MTCTKEHEFLKSCRTGLPSYQGNFPRTLWRQRDKLYDLGFIPSHGGFGFWPRTAWEIEYGLPHQAPALQRVLAYR